MMLGLIKCLVYVGGVYVEYVVDVFLVLLFGLYVFGSCDLFGSYDVWVVVDVVLVLGVIEVMLGVVVDGVNVELCEYGDDVVESLVYWVCCVDYGFGEIDDVDFVCVEVLECFD